MSQQFWLDEEHLRRICEFFPKTRGVNPELYLSAIALSATVVFWL